MPYTNKADKAANDRKTYLRRRELAIARERARQLADPVGYKRRMREYYQGRGRDKNYRHLYGITLTDYQILLEKQDNKCAICGAKRPSGKRENFAVDHCHATHKVRGLLCIRCNSHLGWFDTHRDSITKYLESQ